MKKFLTSQLLLIAAGTMVAALTLFKFFYLDLTPPAFYLDESSIGYNAYRIWQSGTDEYGTPYPLYFEAFGDYKNPIYIYATVPLLAIVGVSESTVRLTAALLTLASLVLFALFLKKLKTSPIVYVATLLLISSSPWFVLLGRVAFELAAFPLFLIAAGCGLYLLLQRTRTTRTDVLLAGATGLSFGMLFYTYTAARLLVPLLVAPAFVLLIKLRGRTIAMTALLMCAVCFIPLVVQRDVANQALMARYQIVGLSNYTETSGEFLKTVAYNYWQHWQPNFWLKGGDGNLRHVPAPYGIMLFSGLVALVAGVVASLQKTVPVRQRFFFYWCLYGLLISPLPAALTIQAPHVLRSIGLLPFSFFFIWQGVAWWSNHRQRWVKVIGAALLWLAIVQSGFLLHYLSTDFPKVSALWYSADLVGGAKQFVHLPGPYFISSELRQGEAVTARFQAAKFGLSLADPAIPLHIYDTNQLRVAPAGSYLLAAVDCDPNSVFQFLNKPSWRKLFGNVCVVRIEQPAVETPLQ